MAAMTTALTEFADNGNSRTYTTAGHTASKPKLVIQKRRVAEGNQVVQETSVAVVHATTDPDGQVLPQKVAGTLLFRSPINGDAADVTAVLTILRDICAGDEYGNTVTTQEHLV